jgi:hypothetical protein
MAGRTGVTKSTLSAIPVRVFTMPSTSRSRELLFGLVQHSPRWPVHGRVVKSGHAVGVGQCTPAALGVVGAHRAPAKNEIVVRAMFEAPRPRSGLGTGDRPCSGMTGVDR